MKIQRAMSYAKHANSETETIASICKWLGKYCVFILRYEVIVDEEPEDNGPRFTIEYLGGQLDDFYEVEGDTYDGHDLDELANDIIELIDINRLTFGVYPVVIDTTEVIPEIYNVLLPGYVPKFDEIKDWQLYEHLVDRILHMVNVTHVGSAEMGLRRALSDVRSLSSSDAM